MNVSMSGEEVAFPAPAWESGGACESPRGVLADSNLRIRISGKK
jgi:hypothetical protein